MIIKQIWNSKWSDEIIKNKNTKKKSLKKKKTLSLLSQRFFFFFLNVFLSLSWIFKTLYFSLSFFLTAFEIFSEKSKLKQANTHIFSGKSNNGRRFSVCTNHYKQKHWFVVQVCAQISLSLLWVFVLLIFYLVTEKMKEMWTENLN